MGFGGPHAAFLATRDAYARSLPGRLVGVSTDTAGRPALRLALQTREQHIRREKATSNICTAQVLLANIAGMYAVWHGPDGLTRIAERVHRLTSILAAALRDGGHELVNDTWFDTLQVRVPGRAAEVIAAARARRINLRPVDADTVGLSLDETTTPAVLQAVAAAFGLPELDVDELDRRAVDGLPASARRTGELLTHPVFNRYHSEHELLRYLRRLADRDLALDRTMIPLGSCTMKLNAAAEMLPITWPELSHLHPFAPTDQAAGLPRADRPAGAAAGRHHRLRRGQPPAERRQPGRAGRPAGHPRLPPQPGRRGADRLPHPLERARHERRQRGHGRAPGGRGGVRRRGQRRPRRPAGQGRRRGRSARRGHGHLPVDARCVRGGHRRAVRRRPRARWAGLRRRRQPQRARRRGPAGPLRRRRQPPQPAQDVLHPPRRRRAGGRSHRRAGPPRALPARPPAGPSPAGRGRSGGGGAVRVGRHPAHLLGVPRARWGPKGCCGRPRWRWPAPTTWPPASGTTSPCSTPAATGWSRTSASSTCARSRRPPASRSTTWPSG